MIRLLALGAEHSEARFDEVASVRSNSGTAPVLELAFQARRLAFQLGLEGKTARKAAAFLQKLASAYVRLDCSLLEINPLVITGSGDVLALDAKVSFDDNALYRHPDVMELQDRIANRIAESLRLELDVHRHTADVPVAASLIAITGFAALCLGIVWWIFRTGYRLKT